MSDDYGAALMPPRGGWCPNCGEAILVRMKTAQRVCEVMRDHLKECAS